MQQIKEKGDVIGKPLKYTFFREKKIHEKRLYYLIYKEHTIILAIAIGNKKTQQETITAILSELERYQTAITKRLKEL